MSAQSIELLSIDSLKEEIEDFFIKSANSIVLKDYYALGEGYCKSDLKNKSYVYKIIKTNKCNLLDSVLYKSKKIEDENVYGYPSNTYEKNKCPEKHNTLYKLWLSKGNTGSIDEFLSTLLSDNKVELKEDNW